jgi:hypothetical protein
MSRENVEAYMTTQSVAFSSRLSACPDDGAKQAMCHENISNTKAILYKKPSSRFKRKHV